jgi:hypothetical protein
MSKRNDLFTIARAEALFASRVPTGTRLDRTEATRAIHYAVRVHNGIRGCAAALAAAYGDYPDTAAPRMRWARQVILSVYPREAS